MSDIETTLNSYKETKTLIIKRLKEIKSTKPFDWKLCAVYERELLEISGIISELTDYLKVVKK